MLTGFTGVMRTARYESVSYTRDGQYLVTGARQDDAVLVWDLRYADQALYRLEACHPLSLKERGWHAFLIVMWLPAVPQSSCAGKTAFLSPQKVCCAHNEDVKPVARLNCSPVAVALGCCLLLSAPLLSAPSLHCSPAAAALGRCLLLSAPSLHCSQLALLPCPRALGRYSLLPAPLLAAPCSQLALLPCRCRTGALLPAPCLQRDTKSTNQRISFSIEPCGRHLLTGGCSGAVRTGNQVDELVIAEGDTVNGCDTHPFLSLLAVSTGINNLMFCCWLLLHPTSVLVVLDLHWTRD
eukprot:scaffold181039_cov15-Tisochrysis_lutea.AAC.1